MAQETRITIIVNKYWECDPVCWVLTNKYINDNGQCNIDLDFNDTCQLITYPNYGPVKPQTAAESKPRMVFRANSKLIEIWCISDLLSNSAPDLQSSSEEKMKLLPIIFNYSNLTIELVVAVGTASSGPSVPLNPLFKTDNINGSVVIGSNVFMHNGWDPDSKSNFKCDCWGQILSSGSNSFIRELQKDNLTPYETLLLCPPTNPSPVGQHFYVKESFVALGDVNVTDYTKYAQKDEDTGNEFIAKYFGNIDGCSLETTHCLIYLAAKYHNQNIPAPFIFVSGIVDRYTKFSEDVKYIYAQNVSGAHNAGVAVAYIISKFINQK